MIKTERPSSRKIVLFELNIGQKQSVWFNSAAGTFYVDFLKAYLLIDPTLLVGVSAQSIVNVGSVSSDSAPLLLVANATEVQATELSFWFDSVYNILYIHLQNGDEPSLHTLIIGITYGVSNFDGVWGVTHFESRLISAPNITKSKDPMFYGKIAYSGGTYTVDNKPAPGHTSGPFDKLGENYDVFGNYARALVGFDDDAYGDFTQADSGVIEKLSVSPDKLVVKLKDPRSALNKRLPFSVFDLATYTTLATTNIGKGIPIGYGVMKSVPVVCMNEAVTPAPVSYSFKLCDTSKHAGIYAITTVYVEHGGIKTARVPATTDLVNGVFTFTVASGFYVPGDKVTCDYSGYKTAGGILIEKALDVVKDIMVTWLGMAYISALFNVAQWDAVAAMCPVVNIWAQSPTEAIKLIEDIVSAARVGFIVQDDGRYTARKYNKLQGPQQVFTQAMLMEIPTVDYDPSEVIVSVMVGYARRWSESGDAAYQWLLDTSQYATIYAKYKNNKNDMRPFPMLLTNAADAQAFASDVLDVGGTIGKPFTVQMKMQPLYREVMDFIQVPVRRRNGEPILGDVVAEVGSIKKNLMGATISVGCRTVRVIPETVYSQGRWWGVGQWGDGQWTVTSEQEIPV